jgi:hypothetical protein
MWILLLLPFIGLLWVPFYNSLEPALFGFPFFYWYQLAWVPISSLLIWLVYRSRTPDEARRGCVMAERIDWIALRVGPETSGRIAEFSEHEAD